MSDESKKNEPRVQADNNSIAVGNISAGGNIGDIKIKTGYTADQVSVLITQIQSTFQPKPFDGRCPYKGLDVFEEEDAELFFGREKLVNDLVGRVKDSRTVFVTGPSGSGKSSLVRAGLIQALKQGAVKNSERWLYATMKPGRDPIESLVNTFSRLKSPALGNYFRQHMDQVKVLHECAESVLTENKNQRLLLFIDQFEEVFTQINKEEERVAFLNLLTHAATIENGRVIILFSMRSDFVSNCTTYPQLNSLLNQQFVQIGAMQPEELVSAIAQPALRVGLRIDPDLIAQIINEMKGEPGALPLMQFALKDLFDSQQEKSGIIALTLNDYLQRGGIHKALERHADDSFAKLSKNEQELARSIFSGLIEIGRGTQDTRRTALFDELIPANTKAADVETIVQKLADARLITTDEQAGKDTVTISHEKLIDAWPWLKKLVNENRDVIALQNEITGDAKEWEERKRDASYLYTGGRLANVCEQLEKQKFALGHLAQEFIHKGRAKQQRAWATLISAVSVALIAAIMASVVFQYQAEANIEIANTAQAASILASSNALTAQSNEILADERATIARSGELATYALNQKEDNFPLSLLLSVEAYKTADTQRTYTTLLEMAQTNPQISEYIPLTDGDGIGSLVFSPDGKTMAVGTSDKIILLDVDTREIVGEFVDSDGGGIRQITFSPNGENLIAKFCEFVLTASQCQSKMILWNISSQQIINQPYSGLSYAISFQANMLAVGDNDGGISLWEPSTHRLIYQFSREESGSVLSLAFSPDGKILVSGSADSAVVLWDIATRKAMAQLTDYSGVSNVTFSPDGTILAYGSSSDNNIFLWDVATLQLIGEPLKGHTEVVENIIFSPDGKILASSSRYDRMILWNVPRKYVIGNALDEMMTGSVYGRVSLAFSPDSRRLALGGTNNNAFFIWKLDEQFPLGLELPIKGSEITEYSPDGNFIASTDISGLFLWDTGKAREKIIEKGVGVSKLAFSSDSKILAVGRCRTLTTDYSCKQNEIFLWDVVKNQQVGILSNGTDGLVRQLVFSPDGKHLASGDEYNNIFLWDVTRQQLVDGKTLSFGGDISGLEFSSNGQILAIASRQMGQVILYDTKTYEPLGSPLSYRYEAYSIAFSPDDNFLVAGLGPFLTWWDVKRQSLIFKSLPEFTSNHLAFSPNRDILAVAVGTSFNIWDVGARQPISQIFNRSGSGNLTKLAFSKDGMTLFTANSDGTVILWKMNPQQWIQASCQRAGRNFTRAEWIQYFPTEEYRKTCERWSLESETTPIASPTSTP